MKRTQIYLDPGRHDFLANLAFLWSKRNRKKITISEVIRSAIDLLQEKYGAMETESETEVILKSVLLLEGVKKARGQKGHLTHQDVFGKK